MNILRGDIVLVNLEPIIGAEQGKIRPAVVVQNNIGNEYSPTTIIAPITS
ncbi:type II toxin-antitoxin system PemK/MazF family toxin, partial [Candidatus Pacearchaeota archaeon]|nr:type II toxin-antitoxin system PemK/MazF family toxin [Candidatus Pacearchaeota archaeon]